MILDVLIRKHKSIKSDHGVTVAVPGSSEQIAQTLFEGALFRAQAAGKQLTFDFGNADKQQVKELHADWENARDREKASRSRFVQHTLDKDTVAAELKSVRRAIGRNEDVARFFHTVLQACKVPVQDHGRSVRVHVSDETPRALRQALGRDEFFVGRLDLPIEKGEIYLGRTSPIVEGLAGWTMDQALDSVARDSSSVASRCGVIASSAVKARASLLLTRFRFHLRAAGSIGKTILCEEIVPLAYTCPADQPQWLGPEESEHLLDAKPERNLILTAIDQQVGLLLDSFGHIQQALVAVAEERAEDQLQAHERVRQATKTKGRITCRTHAPGRYSGGLCPSAHTRDGRRSMTR